MQGYLSTASQADGFGYSARTSTATAVTESAKPYRGRRVSWPEFYQLRPDLMPANENKQQNAEGERPNSLTSLPA